MNAAEKKKLELVIEQEAKAEYYNDPLPLRNIVIGIGLALSLAGAAVYGIVNMSNPGEARKEYRQQAPSNYQKQNDTYIGQR